MLVLLARGFTNQEIAKKLFISVRTAETHRAHVMQKHFQSQAENKSTTRARERAARRRLAKRLVRRATARARVEHSRVQRVPDEYRLASSARASPRSSRGGFPPSARR